MNMNLNMETLALGGLGVVTLVVLVRIFRNGLGTYTETREKFRQRVRKTEEEMREYNLALPLQEQMAFMLAATRELLELEEKPEGFDAELEGDTLRLDTPQGAIRVRYAARARRLHTQNRVLHGAARWEILGPGEDERREFRELDAVIKHLDCRITGSVDEVENEPPEFRRRFIGPRRGGR